MKNEKQDKANTKKLKTDNEGVNVTSNNFDNHQPVNSQDADPRSPTGVSVSKVRNELQNVIDNMGPPTTPLVCHTYSSDADNEDSILSTSVCCSVVKIREVTSVESPSDPEDSQMTICNISELPDYSVGIPTDAAVQTHYEHRPLYQHHLYPHVGHHRQKNVSHLHAMRQSFQRTSRFANWLGFKNKNECNGKCNRTVCDLYRINIEEANKDHNPPRRLVFELMDELPKADTKNVGTNTRYYSANICNQKHIEGLNKLAQVNQKNPKKDCQSYQNFKRLKETESERVDIYYFDHGNSEYYKTTDQVPFIETEYLAEQTEKYTKIFWANIFGTVNIGICFIVSFILQFIRFILHGIIRPLTVGIVQLISDYFIKPSLAVLFNGVVQPPLIFLYNVATSVRDVCNPIAKSIGFFIREIAVIFKAIRLVQYDSSKMIKNCNTKPVTCA